MSIDMEQINMIFLQKIREQLALMEQARRLLARTPSDTLAGADAIHKSQLAFAQAQQLTLQQLARGKVN